MSSNITSLFGKPFLSSRRDFENIRGHPSGGGLHGQRISFTIGKLSKHHQHFMLKHTQAVAPWMDVLFMDGAVSDKRVLGS
ncbi:hypothetical protein PIB30_052052 [Stylosanthes scabra]|uniref:Uncharacterized protein n=1 Tax=Stylosanthes scabra TaxID=79078 RepID=A0ABU6UKC4_9FABA|nr:hypothetical protein [Stylosanthes scabra]